ncbi:MAG: hypothetical protein AAF465_17150 [Pseudomonadota bacterium]
MRFKAQASTLDAGGWENSVVANIQHKTILAANYRRTLRDAHCLSPSTALGSAPAIN